MALGCDDKTFLLVAVGHDLEQQFAGLFVERDKPDFVQNQYPELYRQMQAYNENLVLSAQANLNTKLAYEQPSFELSEYGVKDDTAAYIEIPAVGVVLPVYLGAGEENMKRGAVHLSETSLPLGGANTNCVIAAHRNYPNAELFTDLVDVEPGDEVIITNLWTTLTYRVVETATIYEDEVDKLLIQDGKDMLSLFTCTYTGERRDRFVVYCERAG